MSSPEEDVKIDTFQTILRSGWLKNVDGNLVSVRIDSEIEQCLYTFAFIR